MLQAGKVDGKIKIGIYVHTGTNTTIIAFNHAFDTREIPTIKQDYYDADVIIGDDVWIGGGVIILAGVTIRKGAIIGGRCEHRCARICYRRRCSCQSY